MRLVVNVGVANGELGGYVSENVQDHQNVSYFTEYLTVRVVYKTLVPELV